jgi:hypothetical protein
MTDTPDIAHRFDKFTMPCDIPDDDGETGNDRSAGGLGSPASRGLGASGAQDYGVPTQDWLSRGLKSRAGRGWEAEAPRSDPDPDPAPDPDDDPDYGLSYDYGEDPRNHGSGPAAKTPYDHYPSNAALLQARRAGRMGGPGYGPGHGGGYGPGYGPGYGGAYAGARKSAAPHWPAGWLPGDPPREIVLDSDPWADPCSGPGDHAPATAKFGAAQQVRFLDGLALHGNVRAAAARVGVSRDTVYRLRRRDPSFANLWEAALVHARAAGEAELVSRAFDGVATPVFVRGEHVATWRRHDPRYLLTHLARLDRRIAQNGTEEREAQARASCFDEMLAGHAGQPVPAEFAQAAQVGARLAAEDYEAGGREAGEAEPRWLADVPPTRAGVFGLACDQACAAHEEALAAGRKDYRDVAAQDRGEARAVERATTKAVARWERWREEGRALLDRVLAGAEAGEGEGDMAGMSDVSDVLGVSDVSDVSDGADRAAEEARPGAAQPGATGTYTPTPSAEASASIPSVASTASSSAQLSRRPRTKASARKARKLTSPLASTMVASIASSGGGTGSGHSIPARESASPCARFIPSSASTTNLRCAK